MDILTILTKADLEQNPDILNELKEDFKYIQEDITDIVCERYENDVVTEYIVKQSIPCFVASQFLDSVKDVVEVTGDLTPDYRIPVCTKPGVRLSDEQYAFLTDKDYNNLMLNKSVFNASDRYSEEEYANIMYSNFDKDSITVKAIKDDLTGETKYVMFSKAGKLYAETDNFTYSEEDYSDVFQVYDDGITTLTVKEFLSSLEVMKDSVSIYTSLSNPTNNLINWFGVIYQSRDYGYIHYKLAPKKEDAVDYLIRFIRNGYNDNDIVTVIRGVE